LAKFYLVHNKFQKNLLPPFWDGGSRFLRNRRYVSTV